MYHKLFVISFISICTLGCKKESTFNIANTLNGSLAITNKQSALAIQTSSKSFSTINANTGDNVGYFLSPGDYKQNVFTQSPVFIQDVVINFYNRNVIATRRSDSSVKWKCNITSEFLSGSQVYVSYPIITGDLLMFAFYVYQRPDITGIYCIDISNGKLLWFNNDYAVNNKTVPTYANGLLLVNGGNFFGDGDFFAIDIHSGKTKWATATHFGNVYPSCTDSEYVYYTKRLLTLREPADTLFSRNVTDGSIHWFKVVKNADFHCTASVAEDELYTNYNDTLFCFNKNTGKPIWKFGVSPDSLFGFSSIYIHENVVYVNTSGYYGTALYALNATEGNRIWSRPISLGSGNLIDGPVVMNDIVYLRQNGEYITAYNKTNGALIFKTNMNNTQILNPAWAPTYVNESGLMFYSAESGMH